MLRWLSSLGWLACVVYSTIPLFWLMVHPFADHWRLRRRSPYRVLVPVWLATWLATAVITAPWRKVAIYTTLWGWLPGVLLLGLGFYVYAHANRNFSAKQLVGLPELHPGIREYRLVTDGIRARVRHPVYLAYLCQMLACSVGTGLAVCWALTAFTIATGAVMIRMEDAELQTRFGEAYRIYRNSVPSVLPRVL